MKRFFRFRTPVRQSYGIFYIILVTITISPINFTKLKYFPNWSAVRLTSRRHHFRLISVIINSWLCPL